MLHIVFTAEVERSPDTWEAATFLLRLFSDQTTDFQEIIYPDGFTSLSLKSINSSGVIAAIGDLDPDSSTSPGQHALLLAPAELVTDNNHDRQIDAKDRRHTNDPKTGLPDPFYFWINDDIDSGDTGGDDVPGATAQVVGGGEGSNPIYFVPNYMDNVVNGTRDLVDFFPVWLHIDQTLKLLPPDSYDYRLIQADEAVNFTDTVLKAAGQDNEKAGAYLTDTSVAQSLGAKTVQQVTAAGVPLSVDFLGRIAADPSGQSGIILVEGRKATKQPLCLEVFSRADNTRALKLELPLSIDGVEKMYGQKNLRPSRATRRACRITRPAPPTNRRTTPTGLQRQEVRPVHGYSVSGEAARGWGAEMFKRLYWSGSRARFYAVTWFGNDSQGSVPTFPDATPDYHVNVNNAFLEARYLANYLAGLGGADVVAGHSLGNMVVSSAIQDWGAPVRKYFMIDAAVAAEAYGADEVKNANMDHPLWRGIYDETLWASEWHTLFDPSDNRSRLTWRGRFDGVGAQAFNFYSGTEEVLAEHTGNPDLFLDNNNLPVGSIFSGDGRVGAAGKAQRADGPDAAGSTLQLRRLGLQSDVGRQRRTPARRSEDHPLLQ